VASLQERQRLMEQLSTIQRAIARRAPLQHILDSITGGAQELIGDEVVGLRLRDPDDPGMLILVSSNGVREDLTKRLWRVPVAEAGAPGLAMLRDELVVMEQYATSPHSIPDLANAHIQAAMAAPVHENGAVVGGLIVGSYREGRTYSVADREVLLAFAEHVSLAITDAKTLREMYEAFHDSLTKLASRALFMKRLGHDLARAAREQTRLAVLFIDLDRFKVVNDSLGHAAGDTLLVEVANRLKSCLRAGDTAARFGGDEFAVLLQDVEGAEQAMRVADRIITVLREPFTLRGKEIFVDCSVGVALNLEPDQNAEALMQNADLAMYRAKRAGKGHSQVFEPAMQASVQNRLDLEAQLRVAVDRDQLVLHYQPIVELASGRLTGVEALVRWQHPDRGLVAPLEFIPLAEETGLIRPIGRWVLREACRQASEWNALLGPDSSLPVSVNLSARQLQQPELPHLLAQALAESGADPRWLVLEITESVLLHDTEVVTERLGTLKAQGVSLAIDDFGTGYSSLAYLRLFPVDILKIDKTFVAEIGAGAAPAALARAIVNLGHTLELTTVAEGIETAEQFAEVRDSGCRFGQGFYFAPPLPHDEIEAMVLDSRPLRFASTR
jgi:diguanylate cyclase (GGDEF)-like protein